MTQKQQIEQLQAQINAQTNLPVTQPESLGPLKAMGRVFGLIGVSVNVASTALNAVDRTTTNLSRQLDRGFHAVDIASEGMINDLLTDELVADANRRIRKIEAEAEVESILSALSK